MDGVPRRPLRVVLAEALQVGKASTHLAELSVSVRMNGCPCQERRVPIGQLATMRLTDWLY